MIESQPRPQDPAESTATSRANGRRVVLGLLAAAAFLVPAGAGIAVGVTLLGAPVAASAPAPTPAPSETAADPVPTPAAVDVAPVEFSSVSGNLRCRIDAKAAYCHQGTFVYAEHAYDCAEEGAAVGVTAERTYWPCLGARPAQGPAVDYDVPVVNGEFTCVINYTTGVRCTNAAGMGFTMEYSAGVTTF